MWGPLVMTTGLLLVAACGPVHPAPGALAPVPARATNEIFAADLATIDVWEARRASLLRNDGADLLTRGIVLARAGAWLAFAREAYIAHPRAQDADDALSVARQLIESLSSGHSAAAPAAPSALLAAAQKLSPELWARLRELEGRPDVARTVATRADAEIELVRAAALATTARPFDVTLAGATSERATESVVVLPANISAVSVSRLSCSQIQHVARAGRLLLDDAVTLAGAAGVAPADELRTNAHTVHFALASDVLHEPSAALLDGVADVMREHPELSLVIEGHADPRGEDMGNVMLSGRRAERVRQLLVSSGVNENRVLVRMFGARRRDATGTSVLDYARDRRVQLRFVLPDGTELPAMNDASDLQIESQKLWTGALRPGLRRYVPEPGSTDVPSPVPVVPAHARARSRRRTSTAKPTNATQTTPRGTS
jgi:outer membrane protein OmpA-like peptidoglycan-associated protein